ncbi:ATP-dependent RNA helicase HrpA [Leclercia adecarboxylata]|uniref:ATP-dependent RNA helicase HrpA n=1 Tax=Leclercia adecarboxylata TaxID=83655 RepID=A0A4U9HY49_9ENTR|nr:ATP-dependent RNA helicase HrpA [Leclercia adecarboxylata]
MTGRPVTPSSGENLKLRSEVEELEHKTRRRDILVDDETLFEFYDQRISHDVVSARPFRQLVGKRSAVKPRICSTLKRAC